MALSRALLSTAFTFRNSSQIHGWIRDARLTATRHDSGSRRGAVALSERGALSVKNLPRRHGGTEKSQPVNRRHLGVHERSLCASVSPWWVFTRERYISECANDTSNERTYVSLVVTLKVFAGAIRRLDNAENLENTPDHGQLGYWNTRRANDLASDGNT